MSLLNLALTLSISLLAATTAPALVYSQQPPSDLISHAVAVPTVPASTTASTTTSPPADATGSNSAGGLSAKPSTGVSDVPTASTIDGFSAVTEPPSAASAGGAAVSADSVGSGQGGDSSAGSSSDPIYQQLQSPLIVSFPSVSLDSPIFPSGDLLGVAVPSTPTSTVDNTSVVNTAAASVDNTTSTTSTSTAAEPADARLFEDSTHFAAEQPFYIRVAANCHGEQTLVSVSEQENRHRQVQRRNAPTVGMMHGGKELMSSMWSSTSWLWELPQWIQQRLWNRLHDGCNDQLIAIDVTCKERYSWWDHYTGDSQYHAATNNATAAVSTANTSTGVKANEHAHAEALQAADLSIIGEVNEPAATEHHSFQTEGASTSNKVCEHCQDDRGSIVVLHVHCSAEQRVISRIDHQQSPWASTASASIASATRPADNPATATTSDINGDGSSSTTQDFNSYSDINTDGSKKKRRRHVFAIKVDCDSKQHLKNEVKHELYETQPYMSQVDLTVQNTVVVNDSAVDVASVSTVNVDSVQGDTTIGSCSNGTCTQASSTVYSNVTDTQANGFSSVDGTPNPWDQTYGWGEDVWQNDMVKRGNDNVLLLNVNCRDQKSINHYGSGYDVDANPLTFSADIIDNGADAVAFNSVQQQTNDGNVVQQFPHGHIALINVQCQNQQQVFRHFNYKHK